LLCGSWLPTILQTETDKILLAREGEREREREREKETRLIGDPESWS
jgi:hypothetical protein